MSDPVFTAIGLPGQYEPFYCEGGLYDHLLPAFQIEALATIRAGERQFHNYT